MVKNINFYELDKDVPPSLWNPYLKKYSKKYQTFIDEDGITKIKCKFGKIDTYSLKKGYLSFCGVFYSKNKKSFFLRKCLNLIGVFFEITQESDTEVVIKFLETDLEKFEDLFLIKKRKKLTEEHRKKLREHLKNLQKDKNG